MNKTITINLSGIVFHIDEVAYERLQKYLEKLKAHFGNTESRDEIIADIENRIAEMFAEKITDSKQVITLTEVNEVINMMGNPEDMTGDEQQPASAQAPYTEYTRRRFFRNTDDKILGGVCSGISAYFDIDSVWMRLAFAIFTLLSVGTGLFVYILLWIIIPPARTTAEKLEMRGEKVNVSNIEKNVREEFDGLKSRLENLGEELKSDRTKARINSGVNKFSNFVGEVGNKLFAFIRTVFGLIFTIVSLAVLIALSALLFTAIGVLSFAIPPVFTQMIFSTSQLGWLLTGVMLLVGIPFTVLLLNGIKILFKANLNLKRIGAIMLIFWLAGLGITIINGFSLGKEFSSEGSVKQEINLGVPTVAYQLTLSGPVDEWQNEHGNIAMHEGFYIDAEKDDTLRVRGVDFDIEKSDNDSARLIIIRTSQGVGTTQAKRLASAVHYTYSLQGNKLVMAPGYSLSVHNKFRWQRVRVILKLPVGKSVFITGEAKKILGDIDNLNEMWNWEMPNHLWTMTPQGLQCMDCPVNSLPPAPTSGNVTAETPHETI